MSSSRGLTATLLAAALSCATVSPSAGATTAADAADYTYPLIVPDGEGDHEGLAGGPNAANPENDILSVEVTDDPDNLVVRILMASMAFGVPTGSVTVTVPLTSEAGKWEMTAVYNDGGANLDVADYDDTDPTTPDDDVLAPGATVEISGGHIYFFVPTTDPAVTLGKVVTIGDVSTGRGISLPTGDGASQGGLDAAIVSTAYLLNQNAFFVESEEAGPRTLYQDIRTDEVVLPLSLEAATDDTYWYNWTSPGGDLLLDYAAAPTQGSVRLEVRDAAGMSLFNKTLAGADANRVALTATEPGDWSLIFAFSAFTGDVSMNITRVGGQGASAGPGTGGGGGPGTPSVPTAVGSGGAPVNEGGGDAKPKGKGSPGAGLLAVLAGLAATGFAARRRDT